MTESCMASNSSFSLFQLVLAPIFLFNFPFPPYFLFWPPSFYRAILVNHLAQLILLSIKLFPIFFFPKPLPAPLLTAQPPPAPLLQPPPWQGGHILATRLMHATHLWKSSPTPFYRDAQFFPSGKQMVRKNFWSTRGVNTTFFFNIYSHFQNK